MGLGTAQHGGVQHLGEFSSVDTGGFAGEEPQVFLPGNRGTHRGLDPIILPLCSPTMPYPQTRLPM